MIGSSVAYLFLTDSPTQKNEPQNALHPNLLHQMANADFRTKPRRYIWIALKVIRSIAINNLAPSLKRVLKSGTFWIVALAHTGSSMVRYVLF
jgi:predicted ATPase